MKKPGFKTKNRNIFNLKIGDKVYICKDACTISRKRGIGIHDMMIQLQKSIGVIKNISSDCLTIQSGTYSWTWSFDSVLPHDIEYQQLLELESIL